MIADIPVKMQEKFEDPYKYI